MSNINKTTAKHLLGFSTALAAGALASIALAAPAYAQDAPATSPAPAPSQATADDSGVKDIVVTARRRNESLLSTPVSITALTGKDLIAAGIVSLQDMVNFIPGANFQSLATEGSRADRSFSAIVLRGISPSSSSLQTTSVFIDGVPVTSAISIQSITDPARVEVLKGPQSAYFGRETFAGAINVVTKDPNPDHWSGTVNALYGTRANYDVWAELGGPITDNLSISGTARVNGKNGSYQNSAQPQQNLGKQETVSGTLELVYKPTANLYFKAFGLYTQDNDGPAATGLISPYGVTNASGAYVTPNYSNCTFPTGNAWVCGKLPNVTTSANPYFDLPFIHAALATTKNRYISPGQGVQGYGLVSRYFHGHFVGDWKISPSLSLSSLTGYDHQMYSELGNLVNYDSTSIADPFGNTPPYFSFPYLVEGKSKTFSQEVRLSYSQGPLKASVGGSYLYSFSVGDGGGILFGAPSFSGFAPQHSKTYAVFANASYDITAKLNLSLEGRYQKEDSQEFGSISGSTVIDPVSGVATTIPYNHLVDSSSFKNFLPRVIAQYQFMPRNMIYASWSKGINPSIFNNISTLPVLEQSVVKAAGGQDAVLPEKMDSYEVGVKGLLFNNKLRYTIAGFLMYWHNQADQQNTVYYEPGNLTPQELQFYTSDGRVRIPGVEADFAVDITKQLYVDVSGAFIDSYVLGGSNASETLLSGITNFRGKEDPFTSKYSATVSAVYTVPLTDAISGYTRADFVYKSRVYTDVGNTTYTPDSTDVNLRVGAKTAVWSIEAYATNLFNNRSPYSAGDGFTVNPSFSYFGSASAIVTQLRDLRTVGVRLSYNFGK